MIAITAPHDEQIAWAKRGIEAAEKGNMISWLGPLWNNLGWSYDEMGIHEQARAEFTIALDKLTEARMPDWDVAGFNELKQKLTELSAR